MLEIGLAAEKDIAGIVELEDRTFSDPWHMNSVREVIGKEHITTVCVRMDDKIVGYIICYHIVNEGEIARVAVHEDYRRQGIAASMLEFLFEEGARYGLTEFSLEVRESNEKAIALYNKFGFVNEGRRKAYYNNPVEDGLVMWKR